MSQPGTVTIDALLRRIHDRISHLEERLRTIEANVDAEINRTFEDLGTPDSVN